MSNTDRQNSPDPNVFGPHQSDSYDTARNRGLYRASSVGADDTQQSNDRQGHPPAENPAYGYDDNPLTWARLVNPAQAEIVRDISGITEGNELAATEARVAHDRDQEAASDLISGAGSETPEILYDSGWAKKSGFNLRVRWYGVPDDGSRRRWVSNVLSRHSSKTA